MFYIGIDIAKHKHEASIIDSNGSLLCESISFTNSQKGCEKLIALLERFSVTTDNCIISMEVTGHYWLSVYSYLFELGFDLKVINPIQSDVFRKMYIRQTKKDYKDSFVIAQIMRFGQFSASSLSDENVMALRQLSRYRLFLVDDCSDWKRKVVCLLDQVFPEYSKLFSDTFGVTSKELLLKYPTPEDMLSVSTTKLSNFISKCSHGRHGRLRAKEIQNAAKNSCGVSDFGLFLNLFSIFYFTPSQSFKKRSIPASVSGCLIIWHITLYGIVAICAPESAASATSSGLLMLAAIISVVIP